MAGPFRSGQVGAGHAVHRRGLAQGEPGIVAIFEEMPAEYRSGPPSSASTSTRPRRTASSRSSTSGRWTSPWMRRCTKSSTRSRRSAAKRLVIDSLVGFEMALAPGFRTDFRESLYRMIGALTRLGVTIVSTVEVRGELHLDEPEQLHRSRSSADDILPPAATSRSTASSARCCWS